MNVPEAGFSNSIGAPYLSAFWKDPSFDAKIFKVALPKDEPASIQERAYTSPIWYTPNGG